MKNFVFKEEILRKIEDFGKYPDLLDKGSDDEDGFQIFTPDFIVSDMIKIIGLKNINDFNKTILEPASGDGAFTVKILESRLKTIPKNEKYLKNSLIALSTIFSIEMDEDLIIKQRSNIFSLLMLYANKAKVETSTDYIEIAKKIILTNFIWGETNIIKPIAYKGEAVGWYMPTKIGKRDLRVEKNRILFANWVIDDNIINSTFTLEDGEPYTEEEDFSDLGGLFDV